MDLWHGLLLISSIHLLAAASPGPDFVMVSQQTLVHGRRTGLLVSLGITLGLSIHILYSALGLATVIANSTMLLWAIKLLGGCYLIYLGVQGLRATRHSTQDSARTLSHAPSTGKCIRMGFLCNALNPKAPIYFVSLFTIVLSPDMPLMELAIYGIWIMCLQLIWFSSLSLLLSQPKFNQSFKRFAHWIDRVLGAAMIALGIKVLLSKAS